MKIAPILARYLYTQKQLDLPGIGTFTLDGSAEVSTDNSRQQKPTVLEGVSFEPNNSVKEPPDLIEFISTHTGKIKALASADLDSHLELAKQFLNIGKPFLFEGIGTLSRVKGQYSFAPGTTIHEPAREPQSRNSSAYEEQPADYKDVLYHKKKETAWKKPLIFLLTVVGVGLAVWGGYKVYKSTGSKNSNVADNSQVQKPLPVNTNEDTASTQLSNTDTNVLASQQIMPPATLPAGMWKFVVETANRDRALKRYAKLQAIGVKSVQMETKDSLTFKIYFALSAAVPDTARIIDSLRRNYTPAGNKAFVEK